MKTQPHLRAMTALLLFALLTSCYGSDIVPMPANPVWERSQIIPAPSFVDGVNDFHFDAFDSWMMLNGPQGDIVELLSTDEGWEPMTMQSTSGRGRARGSQTRLFKRLFTFPESFDGQRVVITF